MFLLFLYYDILYMEGENVKSDIEISNECKMLDIRVIGKKLGLSEDELELYGKYKAKINVDNINTDKEGKLILVTSINPTPYGEGKTTMSIGINDALNKLNKNSIVVLREPSLGPVFGIKGGAAGGGYSQVVPMEDINLHFTGDIHAIEAANNLLCAIIDNHIYQGNELGIKEVVFNRCVDLNDRALRNVIVKYDNKGLEREDKYNITVASEIMAILCLSRDIEDLKERIGNILVGFNANDKPVYAKDLKCVGAVSLLLKDALKPNLVQTLENNPAIIHGGPFANIAHGCNSIIATKAGLKLADYVVTEAGFGADLGAEKFLDIKCRVADIKPNCIVINATVRSLKYNGGLSKEEINKENLEALKKGIVNLERHIKNMSKYTKNIVVCLNQFDYDTEKEIYYVTKFVKDMGYPIEVCSSFKNGGEGAINLAKKIVEVCNNDIDFKPLYDINETIKSKIKTICTEIYGANDIEVSNEVEKKIEKLESMGLSNLPICIAKTQYSFSDDPKKLGAPTNFNMKVRDIRVSNGAGFIVVLMGNIMTMPGLGKNSAYLNMDINNKGKIKGLF